MRYCAHATASRLALTTTLPNCATLEGMGQYLRYSRSHSRTALDLSSLGVRLGSEPEIVACPAPLLLYSRKRASVAPVCHVCFGSLADMPCPRPHVCFTPGSGHHRPWAWRPLRATSRHARERVQGSLGTIPIACTAATDKSVTQAASAWIWNKRFFN